MRKINILWTLLAFVVLLGLFGCKDEGGRRAYFRKMERSSETIAVGIYKTINPNPVNISNIIEALKIDAGIVAVTLTDEDILRAELENIDVLVFPGLEMGELSDSINSDVVQIIRKFAVERGKGTIGICGGGNIFNFLDNECKTLDLIGVEKVGLMESGRTPGIIKLDISENGTEIFPELKDSLNFFIDFHGDLVFNIDETTNPNIKSVAQHTYNEKAFPLFVTLNLGNGKVFLTASHPESTPGMRWMLPRMVRWVMGRELVAYDQNVFRPEFFKDEILYNKAYTNRFEYLINQLDEKRKKDKIMAMDELQAFYPWFAAEKVRQLLNDKSSDVRLRAAKYLTEIEYSIAIDDLETRIHKERNKKNKEQLKQYLSKLESMLEQSSSL